MVLNMQLETVGGSAAGSDPVYKAANWEYSVKGLDGEAADAASSTVAYLETPCAHCSLKSDCGPANEINPQTCEYMQDWLELF